MHQNSPFSDKKNFCGGGTRPRIAGETRLLIWTTLSTALRVGGLGASLAQWTRETVPGLVNLYKLFVVYRYVCMMMMMMIIQCGCLFAGPN